MRKGRPRYWLPIDERLIPPIFAFGHVKGIARIFLEIEMILSVAVVIGTLTATVLFFLK